MAIAVQEKTTAGTQPGGGARRRLHDIAAAPGAWQLLAFSVIARLPLAMLSVGLLVHTRHLTGSFAAAGVVAGAYGLSLGVGGPLLGQLVDRRGQTLPLLASALASLALLVAMAALPVGASVPVLVALAAAIGLATPPLGACLRTLFPALLQDPATLRAAYAGEASAVELTWIAGPALILALGATWSTGGALVVAGLVLTAGTAAFAAQPASRAWRPASAGLRLPGGSLRFPAMRTLVIVMIAVGIVFGAVEVGVVAAAASVGSSAAAGPLLAVWGVGSLAGGLLAIRVGGGASSASGLLLVMAALTVGHLALVPAAGSSWALGAVLLVAGAAIAPAYASVFAMVDRAAPPGTVTEAFAWLSTAVAIGAAGGAASAGMLADHIGPAAAFALGGGGGVAAVMTLLLRARTLAVPQPPESAAAPVQDRLVAHQTAG